MGYNLDVKNLTKEDWELNNCRERAIYIITNYSKTEKQLIDKLKGGKKKYSDTTIEKVIKFLKDHNFLNDEDFAKRFVETHIKNYSKKVIKQKLMIKGIKRELIEKVLSDEEFSFDDENIVKKLLLKKCPEYYQIKDSIEPKDKQKLYAFLLRKGFNFEVVSRVMKC